MKNLYGNYVLRFAAVLFVMALVGVLIFQYSPRILTPSLFMDEGLFYYKFAFEHRWFEALVKPHMGYYNLLTNVVSVIAADCVPMDYAPYVFRIAVYMVWLAVAGFLFLPGSPFAGVKWLALAVTFLVTPAVGMFSLTGNLTCCHFYCCLLVGLILISKPESPWELTLHRVVLVVAALSGPVPGFMMPVFLLAYYQERSRERLWQTAVLAFGGLVQIAAVVYCDWHPYFYSMHENANFSLVTDNAGARFHGLGELDVFTFWLFDRSLLHPFGDWKMLNASGHYVEAIRKQGGFGYDCIWVMASIAMAVWVWIMAGATSAASRGARYLSAAFLLVAGLSFFSGSAGSAGSKMNFLFAADRYFMVPSVFMAWALVLDFAHARGKWVKLFYGVLVAGILVTGGQIWLRKTDKLFHGPKDWSEQVAMWKKDPKHALEMMSPQAMVLVAPN